MVISSHLDGVPAPADEDDDDDDDEVDAPLLLLLLTPLFPLLVVELPVPVDFSAELPFFVSTRMNIRGTRYQSRYIVCKLQHQCLQDYKNCIFDGKHITSLASCRTGASHCVIS
jgi:hypothetical protein